MTGIEIAALIAACALLALVVFVIVKVSPILSKLNKANVLVDDINGKLKATDPLFTAAGDLGVTISDVNASSRNLATKAVKLSKTSRVATAVNFGRAFFSKKKKYN